MSATTPPAPGAIAAGPPADPRRWIALAVVLSASFMVLLDISIVNTAIPSIQRNLGASYADIQWVLAGYQLSYGVLLITGGRLGDILGRKRMFIAGVTGFTIASAMCGVAPSAGFLIAARVLQGALAAMMYPQVFSVLQVVFPPRERAAAFGVAGSVIGVATISGPLLGGLLIRLGLFDGWRPIFLVNLPIGIGAVLAAVLFLPESKAPDAPRADIAGVAIVSAGLLLLLYPLVQGREQGWPWWTLVMMVVSVVVFIAFAAQQRRRSQTTGSPLVDPALFSDRAFFIGVLVSLFFFAGIPAFFLTFSLYLQIGLGLSALSAGVTTVPFAIGSAAASGFSIRIATRLGKRLLQIGIAVLVLGMVAVFATIDLGGHDIRGVALLPALLLSGIGLGLTVAPLLNIILAGVQPRLAGAASGVLTTVQQVGGAIGVAVIGVIFFGLLSSHADTVAADNSPALAAQLQGHLPAPAAAAAVRGFSACFRDRAGQADPSAVPPSCGSTANSAPVSVSGDVALCPGAQPAGALCSVGRQANADNFAYAMRIGLFFEIAVWLVTFLLIALFPRVKPRAGRPEVVAAH